jgi:transporter family-2 protein
MGIGMALQPPINTALSTYLDGNAFAAAMVSITISALFLSLILVFSRGSFPVTRLFTAPWWIWVGGFIGVLFVAGSIFVIPKLGAAGMIAIVVTAQMFTALLLDHFGIFGLTPEPLSVLRTLGVGFLITGVVLVRFA